ncbi:MAG: hypothetical protein ACE361_16995 [Aureliella sp.]
MHRSMHQLAELDVNELADLLLAALGDNGYQRLVNAMVDRAKCLAGGRDDRGISHSTD